MADGVKDKNKEPVQAYAVTEEQKGTTKQSTMATDGSTPVAAVGEQGEDAQPTATREWSTNGKQIVNADEAGLSGKAECLSPVGREKQNLTGANKAEKGVQRKTTPVLVDKGVNKVQPKDKGKKPLTRTEATALEKRKGPWDDNLKAEVKDFQLKMIFLIDSERKFFAQKTKCAFLLEGDKSTRDASLEAEGTVDGATARISAWASGGTFWTADTYTFFAHHVQKLSWTKIVWNVTYPPKFSFILWLAVLGRLPTLDRLTFLHVDRTCKFCNQQEESLSHLFFTCSFIGDIWKSIREWMGLRQWSMETIQNCFVHLKWDGRGTSWIFNFRKLSFAVTVYYIWECRKKVFFEQYSPDRNHIISKIKIQDDCLMRSQEGLQVKVGLRVDPTTGSWNLFSMTSLWYPDSFRGARFLHGMIWNLSVDAALMCLHSLILPNCTQTPHIDSGGIRASMFDTRFKSLDLRRAIRANHLNFDVNYVILLVTTDPKILLCRGWGRDRGGPSESEIESGMVAELERVAWAEIEEMDTLITDDPQISVDTICGVSNGLRMRVGILAELRSEIARTDSLFYSTRQARR
ncbi:hypothetical protein M9H77_03049 [Catharanthus roseus]|uniref:Uncharacterized protein n=1 Tax=Catharanthus roseus TaxID=4058 RepID=A0ACC0CAM5_CATRO|nr:hypothetical protein M9H77_03049 [Catharanthus roseus]